MKILTLGVAVIVLLPLSVRADEPPLARDRAAEDAAFSAHMELIGDSDLHHHEVPVTSGFLFTADLAFLRYHQSGGIRDSRSPGAGAGAGAEFDFAVSPRVSLGYEFADGLGVRANYWLFNDSAATRDGTSFVSIDASTLDVEVYGRVNLTTESSLEVFGGFRYGEFTQADGQGLLFGLNAPGTTLGLEASRTLGGYGRLYGRARWSLLMDNAMLVNSGLLIDPPMEYTDHETAITELAVGWESNWQIGQNTWLLAGISTEWQQWTNAAVAADAVGAATLQDAGWAGLVLRVGMKF